MKKQVFFLNFICFFRDLWYFSGKEDGELGKYDKNQETQRISGPHCGKVRSESDDRIAGAPAAAIGVGKDPETDF